jgi:hypothetical protein
VSLIKARIDVTSRWRLDSRAGFEKKERKRVDKQFFSDDAMTPINFVRREEREKKVLEEAERGE